LVVTGTQSFEKQREGKVYRCRTIVPKGKGPFAKIKTGFAGLVGEKKEKEITNPEKKKWRWP